MENCKCELIIAGPGAGKTHNMINLIVDTLPKTNLCRTIAVITYTNEAAKEIRERLTRTTKIGRNIFIGTIHSFLIRYFIEPYGHLIGFVPDSATYIDGAKLPYQAKNQFAQKNMEIKRANQLAELGLITYDKVLEISYQIVCNERICKAIAYRIEYLFIDEYQDARIYQHKILQQLFQTGKIKIATVGDPMQSIYSFTYIQSQLKNEPKPDSYDKMPIIDLKNKSNNEDNISCNFFEKNHRSRPNIVNFLNIFNVEINQEYVREDNGVPVHFIKRDSIEKIIAEFFSIQKHYNICKEKDIRIANLILSKHWKTHDLLPTEYRISKISSTDISSEGLLKEMLRCIYGILNLTPKDITNKYNVSSLEIRKFAFSIIRIIKNQEFESDSHLENYIRKVFEKRFNIPLETSLKGSVDVANSIKKIRQRFGEKEINDNYFSSIHTSKGLEATSVLVLAETNNSLTKWLECKKGTTSGLTDEHRLGFVAFSRARDLLCISCLQTITESIEKNLRDFKVSIL